MSEQFIGTKIVTAKPKKKDGEDGYAVIYADGYESWSPAEVFEAAYLSIGEVENLEPHVQRMTGELAQLHSNIDKLEAFTGTARFQELGAHDRSLLMSQANMMNGYAAVLEQRLARATL